MNKSKYLLIYIAVVGGLASAQSYVDQSDGELREEITRESGRSRQRQGQGQAVRAEDSNVNQNSQGVVILNTSESVGRQYIQQPTTRVEAAPIGDSAADAVRKQREAAEIATEQGIVIKLEKSRLDDEKDRADRLFGNRLDDKKDKYDHKDNDHYRDEVKEVKKEIIVIEKKDDDHKEYAESRAESREDRHDDDGNDSMYFAGLVGMTEYPTVSNIHSNMAAGFAIGKNVSRTMQVEGQFMYSDFYVDEYWNYPFFKEMEQYSVSGAAKYAFLSHSRIRPLVGGVAAYTYRNYKDRLYYSNYNYSNDSNITSHAFDLGLTGGVDFAVSDSFTIGAEVRYMFNVFAKSNSRYISNEFMAPGYSDPIEKLRYYTATISAKFKF